MKKVLRVIMIVGLLFSMTIPVFAADNNQATTIQLLCEHGADVHKRYANYGTALDIAEERGQVEASKVLKSIIKQTTIFWKAVDTEDYAAMKTASIPVNLLEAHSKGILKKGDLIALGDQGANWYISSAILKWSI